MPEGFFNLAFPNNGIDQSCDFQGQTPGTTPTGTNVRAFDVSKKRMRGGSRPGLSRYIDAKVEGTNLIQHLGVIVDPTVSGFWPYVFALDDWDFDFWNPGTEFTTDALTGETIRVGGSGVQTPRSFVNPGCNPAYVQSNSVGYGNSPLARTLAYDSNVTNANTLVVCVSTFETGADAEVAITDTIGNTYSQAGSYARSGNIALSCWYTRTTGGANTVTVTPSESVYMGIAVLEYSCVDLSPVEGVNSSSGAAGDSLTTGVIPFLTIGRKVLFLGIFAQGFEAAALFTAGSGFTEREEQSNGDTAMAIYVEDKITAAGVQAASGSLNPTVAWLSLGVCFGPD